MPVDEEVEDPFRRPLGLGVRHAPARKMAVDVHPGKAIDQRAAGDLHPLQVRRAQLARCKRLRQRPLGQRDQFGIVPRDAGRLVVIEKAAAGDDLEMGRDCASPSACRRAQGAGSAPAGRRPAPRPAPASISARKRRCASSATAAIRASRLGKCRNGAPGDTPARRAASRTLRPRRPLADQLQRSIDQHAAEVAVVIGPGFGRLAAGAAGRGLDV